MPSAGPLSALLATLPEARFPDMPVCRSAEQLRTLSPGDMALLCKTGWMRVQGRAYAVSLSDPAQDGRWRCTVRDLTDSTSAALCALMGEWISNRASQLDDTPRRFDTLAQAKAWLEAAGPTLLLKLPRLIIQDREYALCRTAGHQLTVLRTDHLADSRLRRFWRAMGDVIARRGGITTAASLGKAARSSVDASISSIRRLGCPSGLRLAGADLRNADLRGMNLCDVDLRDADLRHAKLSGARLENVNLSGAKLDGASLQSASIRGVDLRHASFSGAVLRVATLIATDLTDAVLNKADLRHAQFEHVKLCGSDLRDTNFRGARLSTTTSLAGADVRNADFSGVWGAGRWLTETDFTVAKSLSLSDITLAPDANLNNVAQWITTNHGEGLLAHVDRIPYPALQRRLLQDMIVELKRCKWVPDKRLNSLHATMLWVLARNPQCMNDPLIHDYGTQIASKYWMRATEQYMEGLTYWRLPALDFTRDISGDLLLACLQDAHATVARSAALAIAVRGEIIVQLVAQATTQFPRIKVRDPDCWFALQHCLMWLKAQHRNKLPAAWAVYDEWELANPGRIGWPRISAGGTIDVVPLDSHSAMMGRQTAA